MSDPAIVTPTIARPEPAEYSPYHEGYISLVPGNDILSTLDSQRRQMLILLSGRDGEHQRGDRNRVRRTWRGASPRLRS